MKHLIPLIILFFTCIELKAQQTAMDFIYSSDGFEVKTVTDGKGYVDIGEDEFHYNKYVGLYSKDGKILVAAISSNKSDSGKFYVLDGCETICSGAFQAFQNTEVFIPTTVINIAPDALKSNVHDGRVNKYGGIFNGAKEISTQNATYSPTKDCNSTEVARYNLQGIRLNEPVNGINIVQMSDGTATKQLIR